MKPAIKPQILILCAGLWLGSGTVASGQEFADRIDQFEREPNATTLARLETIARRGHRPAMFALSNYLADVDFPMHDAKRARTFLMLAAGPGDSADQFQLATRLLGADVTRVDGLFWLTQAAENGHNGAQLMLAGRYARGDGVEADAEFASRWLEKAAMSGSPRAQYQLAMEIGLPDGEIWLRRAAESGDALAQRTLGAQLASGGDLETDEMEARRWLLRAAESGDRRAMLLAGLFLQTGRGGQVDEARAQILLTRADMLGEAGAASFIDQSEESPADTLSRTVGAMEALIPTPLELNPSGRVLPANQQLGFGSGFYVSSELIVTNYHVVSQCGELRDADGSILRPLVELPENDIAILNSDTPSPAWLGLVRSAPQLDSEIVTQVVDSRRGQITDLDTPSRDQRYVRFNVRVEPGDSGAALTDGQGRAVGVITAKLTPGAAYRETGRTGEQAAFALRSDLLAATFDVHGLPLPEAQGRPEESRVRVECWY